MTMPQSSAARTVLDSAYRCFCRTGFHRTTIREIAQEARLSRQSVYKHVGCKRGALVKLTESTLGAALAAAEQESRSASTPAEKAQRILDVKLGVAFRLWADSPAHAQELRSAARAAAPEVFDAYDRDMAGLLTTALDELVPGASGEVAGILLTFARGLEIDPRDASAARLQLRTGVHLITAGALTSEQTPDPFS